MVMHNLDRIAAALMRAGWAPQSPAAVITAATLAGASISTLQRVAGE
jgi:siroheme synthase